MRKKCGTAKEIMPEEERKAMVALYCRKYRGLMIVRLPSGSISYRVRKDGDKRKVTVVSVPPTHFDFERQYFDARLGIKSSGSPLARLNESGNLEKFIKSALQGARYRAEKRGRECTLKRSDIVRMLESQRGRCALSGIEFDLTKPDEAGLRRAFAPSIDRINPALDYTPENTRLLCLIVNTGRSDWTDEDYIKACRAVADNW